MKFPKVPDRYHLLLRILGIVVLSAGAIWAVGSIDLQWQDLVFGPLLINLVIAMPSILIVAAFSLQMSARALNVSIPFKIAIGTVARANVAELLPIPGGAIVRGAALVQAGATAKSSALIVTVSAILTLSMTVSLSAGILALSGHWIGWLLLVAGLAGSIGAIAYVVRIAGVGIALQMTAIRALTICISAVALYIAFLVLGTTASLMQAALLVVSTTLGSAVSIVPAGLGVNEAIAAALASLVQFSAAAAFLGVALNRALGLIAGAVISAIVAFLN